VATNAVCEPIIAQRQGSAADAGEAQRHARMARNLIEDFKMDGLRSNPQIYSELPSTGT
jgi:hypothetical protein